MATKLVRRPELTFWEKLYLPQIYSGLKITTYHFLKNLLIHLAHRLGRLKNVRAGVTIQYPEELRPLMSRYRSRHRLTTRDDGSPRCVACGLCETVCPAKCITIVPGEHPDPNVEKYPQRFDLDLGVCVYCGYCVEVCPDDAIRMDTGILDLAAYSRDAMQLDIHELMNPALRKPLADCDLEFPHECKVTGQDLKGSWEGLEDAHGS